MMDLLRDYLHALRVDVGDVWEGIRDTLTWERRECHIVIDWQPFVEDPEEILP